MLTILLMSIPPEVSHKIQGWLGIKAGMHDWLHGFCPCDE